MAHVNLQPGAKRFGLDVQPSLTLPACFDYLVLPGWHGSGGEHWQTHWEAYWPVLTRVEQDDWERPDYKSWSRRLSEYLARRKKPTVLIGHSLGATLIAHWSGGSDAFRVAGAFLVAPADCDAPSLNHRIITGFGRQPPAALAFPSVLVASTNDEYLPAGRAESHADAWGSRFVNIGERGHIGSAANLGLWREGLNLFHAFAHDLAKAGRAADNVTGLRASASG